MIFQCVVGKLLDPFALGDLGGHLLGPLLGVDEEPFVVELDVGGGDGHGGHGQSFLSPMVAGVLPAVGMVEAMPGMSRPGRRLCQ